MGRGVLRNLTSDNPGEDTGAVFALDGRLIFFLPRKSPFDIGEFARFCPDDLGTGQDTPIAPEPDLSVTQLRVAPDGKWLWVLAEEKGRVGIWRLKPDGSEWTVMHVRRTAHSLEVGSGGAVFLENSSLRPDDLMALDPQSGAVKQLTGFNADLLEVLALGSVDDIWFEGADDQHVQGWLVYPPKHDPKQRCPLVQVLHGGPHPMAGDD